MTLAQPYAFLGGTRVIPVMVIDHIEHAIPMAEALVAGGLTNLEITLRTHCAIDAIKAIRDHVQGATVGAGTVLSIEQLEAVTMAGAEFVVTPGATSPILEYSAANHIALLPGAVTASEVMNALAHGFDILKFFPAGTSGGAAAIKALGGPFGQVKFMPTGGVTLENLGDYLALPNILAVGGSWMIPKKLVESQDWQGIRALASQAVSATAQFMH